MNSGVWVPVVIYAFGGGGFFFKFGEGGEGGGEGEGGEGGEVTWFFFRGKGGESVVATEYKEGPQKIDCLLMASQGRGGGDGVI